MPEFLYDSSGSDHALWVFILVTVIMGGGAAYATGKAVAQTWRPYWQLPIHMLLLAAAVRFCHYALFWEPFLSLKSYAVDYAVALLVATLGFRLMRARQMARQYRWLVERNGLLGWKRVSS